MKSSFHCNSVRLNQSLLDASLGQMLSPVCSVASTKGTGFARMHLKRLPHILARVKGHYTGSKTRQGAG